MRCRRGARTGRRHLGTGLGPGRGAAGRLPPSRHASGGAELPGHRQHRRRRTAGCHLRRASAAARHGRGRRAVGRGGHRAARRADAARHRRIGIRLARRQVRRQRQRPAAVVGGRRPNRHGAVAPGVLRQPAGVLPYRPPGGTRHARPDRRRGPLRGRTACRGLAHGRRRDTDDDPAGAVRPGRHHRDTHDRRTPGDRRAPALPASPGRHPRLRGVQRGRRRGAGG